MIVYASKPGQLGNLLIVSANIRAYQLETGVNVVNPALHKYTGYFAATEKQSSSALTYHFFYLLSRIVHRLRISSRIISCSYLEWHERLDLDKTVRPPALWLLQGWQIRCDRLLKKHAAAVKQYFAPAPKYQDRLDKFRQKFGTKNIIVGIHIRRGDYRTFENGRYFYTLSQYKNMMLGIRSQLGTEHVSFLVSSNEQIAREELSDPSLEVHFTPGHELLDLYALSACNYLAGPPSTYSMWASFYGNVPLYMIREPERVPTMNEFVIQETF